MWRVMTAVQAMVSFAWVCTAALIEHRLTAHPAKLTRTRLGNKLLKE